MNFSLGYVTWIKMRKTRVENWNFVTLRYEWKCFGVASLESLFLLLTHEQLYEEAQNVISYQNIFEKILINDFTHSERQFIIKPTVKKSYEQLNSMIQVFITTVLKNCLAINEIEN